MTYGHTVKPQGKARDCKHHPGGKRSLCPLTMSMCDADGKPCPWGRKRD